MCSSTDPGWRVRKEDAMSCSGVTVPAEEIVANQNGGSRSKLLVQRSANARRWRHPLNPHVLKGCYRDSYAMKSLILAFLLTLVEAWVGKAINIHPFERGSGDGRTGIGSWNTSAQVCGDETWGVHAAAADKPKYSLIIVSHNSILDSNLFQDQERVCAYSEGEIMVQTANPFVRRPVESTLDTPPFFVGHPSGSYKRVRILDMFGGHSHQVRMPPHQVEQACVKRLPINIGVMAMEPGPRGPILTESTASGETLTVVVLGSSEGVLEALYSGTK